MVIINNPLCFAINLAKFKVFSSILERERELKPCKSLVVDGKLK